LRAALGLGHGGLGLRSTSHHASAAFLASWASALQVGPELDVTFCPNEAKSCPEVVAALACFNSKLEPAANINLDDILSSKQHALSQRLDNAGWQEQLGNATIAGRATLLSEASVGGRAFLAAIPSGRTRMEPAAFISELRAGLQIPDADTDAWCPLCDGVLDIHNYHAGDVCGRWRAHSTPLCCPIGHTGLASGRNGNGRAFCFRKSARRRPADVFLPAFAGSPSALDFAIAAPQRQETLAQASQKPLAAAAGYAEQKEHLQTAEACRAQGACFIPMVAESTCAWDADAMIALKHVAQAVAQSGEDPATCSSLLLQELGVAIRSFRARAALRRRSEGVAR